MVGEEGVGPNEGVGLIRLGWVGLGWVGLGWVGLGWHKLGWVRARKNTKQETVKATETFKVVFCRVRTNHTRGIYPGYYPTKNFCKFCRTFIPVPGTSGSSVRQSYPYPEILEVLYASATNTRGTGIYIIFITYVSSVRPCDNTQNFSDFCNTSVPYP